MNKEALKGLEVLNQIKLNDVQKEDVLSFFAKREEDEAFLNAVKTNGVEPMVQAIPATIELREDEIRRDFSPEDLQAQAPQTDRGYFCVPRVIE
jgi:aspartyl/glutamyl-tRNA(Asn/Gln) amidotransferase C subunit